MQPGLQFGEPSFETILFGLVIDVRLLELLYAASNLRQRFAGLLQFDGSLHGTSAIRFDGTRFHGLFQIRRPSFLGQQATARLPKCGATRPDDRAAMMQSRNRAFDFCREIGTFVRQQATAERERLRFQRVQPGERIHGASLEWERLDNRSSC